MVKKLTGGYKIKYHANGVDKDPIEIDFSPPFRWGDVFFCLHLNPFACGVFLFYFLNSVESNFFLEQNFSWKGTSLSLPLSHEYCRRIDMIQELETMANLSIPKDLSSEEANKYLIDACLKFDVKCPPPQTTARLLDKVYHWNSCMFLFFTVMGDGSKTFCGPSVRYMVI